MNAGGIYMNIVTLYLLSLTLKNHLKEKKNSLSSSDHERSPSAAKNIWGSFSVMLCMELCPCSYFYCCPRSWQSLTEYRFL